MVLSVSGERLYKRLCGQVRNTHVLTAIRSVPRDKFLDASLLPYAGDDEALPIGHEQTTSAPLVIARMLEMMLGAKKPPLKILEIGSGSGYQTALLAEMGCTVVGIERIRALAAAARRCLQEAGYGSAAAILHGDGFEGAADSAPFDGIVVCAECLSIPPPLPLQLAESALLVLPLRQRNSVRLVAVNAAGKVVAQREEVRFVNMRKGVA